MSETGGSAVKKMQRSDGVLEYWSTGFKLEENVCYQLSDGISEFLSCGFFITPLLHHSRKLMKYRQAHLWA
jgi:hypothetical protein